MQQVGDIECTKMHQKGNQCQLKPFLLEFMNDLLNNQPSDVLQYMIDWSAQKMQQQTHKQSNKDFDGKVQGQKLIQQQQKIQEQHDRILQCKMQGVINDFVELAHDYVDYFKAYADGACDRYMLQLQDSFYGIEQLRVLQDDMHLHRAKLFEVIDQVNKAKERLDSIQQEKMTNEQKLRVLQTFYESEKANLKLLGDIHQPRVH